jgi:FAD/FMN-containing dehydrogenase
LRPVTRDRRAQARRAVVEPGVINADLKAAAAPAGLVYAPDPASTPISTIGGNIAENAGGPGCIEYGVTFHHVLALDGALADGRLVTFSDDDEVDLLGVTIGWILGVVTRAVVNLMPIPAARWTALASFDCVQDAALTISEIIAAGILPAALEICDKRSVEVMEAHLPSGYPTDKDAILIVELDGKADDVARETPALEKILRRWDHALRTAADEQDRAALWAGRLTGGSAYGDPVCPLEDPGLLEHGLHELGVRSVAIPRMSNPGASSSTGAASATRSNGASDAKDGSTTSNAATAGTAPNSPASTAPEPGVATASSPITSSR